MAYMPRPDGLNDVSMPDGSMMPMALSAQELEAMGHSRMSDAAVRPPMNPSLVAGPGGGDPRDLGGGAGVFSTPLSPEEQDRQTLRSQLAKAPGSHETRPEPSKFDAQWPGMRPSVAPELAPHSTPRAPAAPAADNGLALTPEQELAFREATQGGGGPVRDQRYMKEAKVKRTEYGAVPAELSADIGEKRAQLDQDEHDYNIAAGDEAGQLQDRRESELHAQAMDVARARDERQSVNARLQQLSTARDQREREISAMPPADMNHYWKDKGIASEVMTGISIALGGYLQGLRGGENPGLTMANQAIDRWMEGQKDAYSKARGRLDSADSEYAKAMAIYGSPEMAENDLRARAYAVRDGLYKNELDKLGTSNQFRQNDIVLQKGTLERQQLKAQAAQLAGEKAIEETFANHQVGGGGGGRFLKGLRAASEVKDLSDHLSGKTDKNGKPIAGAAASPLAVHFPDGSVGVAGSSREKAASQKVVRSAWGGMNDIDRIIKLTDGASSREWGSDEKGQAEALAGALLLKVHDAHGIATFQQATADLMHEMIGDPTKFARNPAAVAKLKEVRRGLEDAIHEQRKFLAPAGSGAGAGGGAEPENDLPDSAQEVVE